MVSSDHIKLLSKFRLHGSGDNNEVNKSEEFDGKHYFVGSFCFTGVSGSCVIPSLARSASYVIPFFLNLFFYNHTEKHYIQFYTYINYIKDPSYVNCATILIINIDIPLTLFCLHCL